MNIGLVTFQRAHNYGAQFQAYALQKFLNDKGHHVEFVDYWPDYRKGMYDLLDLSALASDMQPHRKLIATAKSLVKLGLTFPWKKKRNERFAGFIDARLNIPYGAHISRGRDMPRHYDAYIFGSDQIWRYNRYNIYTGYDATYWGRYPENSSALKIAYAASMGVTPKGADSDGFIARHLPNFQAISVREKSLMKLIAPLTGQPVYQVLDPAFLLDRNEWSKIASEKVELPERFVLLYNLNKSAVARQLAEGVAARMGCEVLEVNNEVAPLNLPKGHFNTAGPAEFLTLLGRASYVISTSFHGVVFSLIFRKEFQALGLGDNAARVTDLLAELNIKGRYAASGEENLEPDLTQRIDFDLVHLKLDRLRKQSIDFLTTSLAGEPVTPDLKLVAG
jgi:hypothetical protein